MSSQSCVLLAVYGSSSLHAAPTAGEIANYQAAYQAVVYAEALKPIRIQFKIAE